MTKIRQLSGEYINVRSAQGMTPRNAPKYGMIFVTPMMILMRSAFLKPMVILRIKQKM